MLPATIPLLYIFGEYGTVGQPSEGAALVQVTMGFPCCTFFSGRGQVLELSPALDHGFFSSQADIIGRYVARRFALPWAMIERPLYVP